MAIKSDNKTMDEKPNDFAKMVIAALSLWEAYLLFPLSPPFVVFKDIGFWQQPLPRFAAAFTGFSLLNYILCLIFFCGEPPLIISIWESIKNFFFSSPKETSMKKEIETLPDEEPEEDLDLSFVDREMDEADPPLGKKEKEPSPREIDIIFFISDWRAISLQCLYDHFPHAGSYSNFSRIIQKLVERDFVKYILQEKGGRNKFLTLGEKGYDYTETMEDLNASYYKHDITATTVVLSLSGKPPFFSSIPPGYLDHPLNPDGILLAYEDDDFKVAVEIELTAKSKFRISEKIKSYVKDKDFKKVLYVFRDERLFRIFQKIVNQSEKAKKKFVLNLDKNLSPASYDPEKSRWYPHDFKSSFLDDSKS